MSPLPSIRNRSGLVSASSTPGRDHDPAKFPPSFRISRTAAYNTHARNSGLRYRGPRPHAKPKVRDVIFINAANHSWPLFQECPQWKRHFFLSTFSRFLRVSHFYKRIHPRCFTLSSRRESRKEISLRVLKIMNTRNNRRQSLTLKWREKGNEIALDVIWTLYSLHLRVSDLLRYMQRYAIETQNVGHSFFTTSFDLTLLIRALTIRLQSYFIVFYRCCTLYAEELPCCAYRCQRSKTWTW